MPQGKSGIPVQISLFGRRRTIMEKRISGGTLFLAYANEAAGGIREINRLMGGTGMPENGSLLCGVYYRIADMVRVYLSGMTGEEMHGDVLNDITTEIMCAGKDGVDGIVRKYLEPAGEGGEGH